MGKTSIEWTNDTWNPVRARRDDGKVGWHCEHVSAGCKACYAESINRRLGTHLEFKPGHRADIEIFLDETMLLAPLRWRRPRMIFVGSMTDLFADFVPDAMLDGVFAIMALASRHAFQVLTKRPVRMRAYLSDPATHDRITRAAIEIWLKADGAARRWPDEPDHVLTRRVDGTDRAAGPWPLPNVWLGTSCEDQATADARIPELLETPAAIRFASAEPLLGPIDFRFRQDHCDLCGGTGTLARWPKGPCHVCKGRGSVTICGDSRRGGYRSLDWIIVGGESGRNARPMHPEWAREIRDQCAAAGVAFLFKQIGEWKALSDPTDDGFWPVDSGGCITLTYSGERAVGGTAMQRVGKKFAGRLLDGVEHNGMPAIRSAVPA